MSGWLFYRTRVRGFGHWGYNFWYTHTSEPQPLNPYEALDGAFWPTLAAGDPFVVYPGATGPVDSIRWEIFAESLQDYALLQTAGVDPAASMLADIKDYAEFPRGEDWITSRRAELLAHLDRC